MLTHQAQSMKSEQHLIFYQAQFDTITLIPEALKNILKTGIDQHGMAQRVQLVSFGKRNLVQSLGVKIPRERALPIVLLAQREIESQTRPCSPMACVCYHPKPCGA